MKNVFVLFNFLLVSVFSFPVEAISHKGWYVGVHGGANFMNTDTINDVSFDMHPGFLAGGMAGYRFLSKYGTYRLEGEVSYRRNSFDKASFLDETYHPEGHVGTLVYMANFYNDLPIRCLITPYWGFGLGYVENRGEIEIEDQKVEGLGKGFAYQWIGGVSYPVLYQMEIGLEYRFLAAKNRSRDHSIGINLKKYF